MTDYSIILKPVFTAIGITLVIGICLKTSEEDPALLGWAAAKAQKSFDFITEFVKEGSESEDMAIAT